MNVVRYLYDPIISHEYYQIKPLKYKKKMENEIEDNPDSIRFIWNVTPSSKVQQARSIIHPAFHYTPLGSQAINKLEYTPLFCSCEAVLNKFCTIDFNLKTVRCCFCQSSTPLPQAYVQSISPKKLPY